MKSKSHGTGSQLPKVLREALLCSPLWGQVHAGAAELSGASLLPRGAQLGPPSPVPLALSRPSQCHSLRQRAGSLRTGALSSFAPVPRAWHQAQHSGAQSTAAEEAPPLTDTASRCPVKVCRCWQLRASQIRMSLLRSPEACGDEDNGRRHPPCAQASHPPPGPTLPYEVLAVGGDGHAEDVAAVPGGLPLGPFLGSWDHVKLPSTLHAP